MLAKAVARLREVGIDDPAPDARILLAHALQVDRSRLTLVLHDEVTPEQATAFERFVDARCNRQPVAQIVGLRAFYGRDFVVTQDVLDPRPDTELIVDLAISQPFASVLDLGTGSGCILLSLLAEMPDAIGIGVDLSDKALEVAERNAAQLDVATRATLMQGSWFDPLEPTKQFDLIVSNPPYITKDEMGALAPEVHDWEPHMALTPGGDGLEAYRRIISRVAEFLVPSGRMLLEIGYEQATDVTALCRAAGFKDVLVHKDLSGKDRVVAASGLDRC
nr:peptide chain release factor N(5)-glutamine methyltransferase [Aliiroseovarius sp. F20344]